MLRLLVAFCLEVNFNFIFQANNFVVYDGFFKNRPKSSLTNRLHNQRSQFPRNLINSGAGVGADRHFSEYRKTNSGKFST